MLRKLFIGLLILSALSAKGAGSGISDLAERFSPESFLSLCGDNWLSDAEAADIREINLSKGTPVFRGNALLSLDEFLRVKSLEQHIYCSIEDNYKSKGFEPFLYCAKPVSRSNIRDLVSCGTDISPPAL